MNVLRRANTRVQDWITTHPITTFWGGIVVALLASYTWPEVNPSYYVMGIGLLVVVPLLRRHIDQRVAYLAQTERLRLVREERDLYRDGLTDATNYMRDMNASRKSA